MKHVFRRKPYLIPLFLILGFGAVALFGWIVMLLWNGILVPAAGAHIISFWQGLGLLVLSRILVGGFGGGRGRHRNRSWKEKCENLSPEEKEQMKKAWQQRWGGGEPEQPVQ